MASVPPRLRVLHYITRLGLGGAEAVALSIVRGLQHEIDFGVFAVRGVERSEIGRAMQEDMARMNVPVFSGPKLPLKVGGLLLAGVRAHQVVRQFQPDIVHLHTEIPEAAYAVMRALGGSAVARPSALVRTIHNSVYWHFWPRLGRWCENRMRDSFVAGVSQDAVSAFLTHRATAGTGALPAPPTLIYNGIEPPRAVSPPLPRPVGVVRVLFAGRLEHEKGADLVPEIIRRTKPPPHGAELVCHGRGVHERELRQLAAHAPAGWTVRVLPPVANLRARLQEFDAVLMPSRFEGLGLIAVEAALAGVPVVATDAPGLREALPAGYPGTARLGDLNDYAARLQQLLVDPYAWSTGVADARRFAQERFDARAMAESYRRLYDDSARRRPAAT